MSKRNSYSTPEPTPTVKTSVASATRGAEGKVQHFITGHTHSIPNRAGVGQQQSPKGAMHSVGRM